MTSAPFFALVAALANAVFFLPKVPEAAEPVASLPGADKLGHILVFTFTTWAFSRLLSLEDSRALSWSPRAESGAHQRGSTRLGTVFGFVKVRHLLGLIVTLLLWGAAIEILQSFMPARSADVTDVLADACGIALGVGALWIELALAQRSRARLSTN
ncbi:VanZ family protein [Dermabacter vaginalis]|uniref:VanZ family protein n=1 Tax=Dermabacter vaginalis TaxID=1630135 RepID=A0ABX6A5X6_9MICO|nr:VanZ family protein [Dermabacter vaginalis]QEU12619.1 VanZ family protein [Dermabacter vaginalis]